MLSTGEEVRSPQRSSRSGPILAKMPCTNTHLGNARVKGGGVQGNIFGRISFERWAPQVPLIIGETFGEVPGPRRLTVSEPRPAQKLGVK